MKRWWKVFLAISLVAPSLIFFQPSAQAGYQASLYYTAPENGSLTATAPTGAVFTQVVFASYGTPTGSGPFALSGCNASTSVSYVSSLAIGQNQVVIYANNVNFGDPCSGTGKKLAVELGYTYSLVNSAVPTITGSLAMGQTITSSTGSWNYTPTSYAYQWQRSLTSGGTYNDVSGATSSTYTFVAADIGYYFRVKLTATNDAGTAAPVYSANTGSPVASLNTTTTLSISGSPTQAAYRTALPIVIGVSVNGRVTILANGKAVPGCKNVLTVSLAFTCNWKPAIHAPVTLVASYSPTQAGYLASTSAPYKLIVIVRSNNR